MKASNHPKSAAKNEDFLSSVARSIGSTLGAVAAKVNPAPHKSRRRPAARKRVSRRSSVSTKSRRTAAKISRSGAKAAALKHKNRRRASK
jgi:hypothetical protein